MNAMNPIHFVKQQFDSQPMVLRMILARSSIFSLKGEKCGKKRVSSSGSLNKVPESDSALAPDGNVTLCQQPVNKFRTKNKNFKQKVPKDPSFVQYEAFKFAGFTGIHPNSFHFNSSNIACLRLFQLLPQFPLYSPNHANRRNPHRCRPHRSTPRSILCRRTTSSERLLRKRNRITRRKGRKPSHSTAESKRRNNHRKVTTIRAGGVINPTRSTMPKLHGGRKRRRETLRMRTVQVRSLLRNRMPANGLGSGAQIRV